MGEYKVQRQEMMMKNTRRSFFALVALVAACGCSGGSDDGSECDTQPVGYVIDCDVVGGDECAGDCCGICRMDFHDENAAACDKKCCGACDGECESYDSDGNCNGTCEGICDGECMTLVAGTCDGECLSQCIE